MRIELPNNGNLKIGLIPQSGQGSKGIEAPTATTVRNNEMKKSDNMRIKQIDDGNLKICPIPQPGQGSKGIEAPTAMTFKGDVPV